MNLNTTISKLLENWPAKVLSLVIAIFIMFLYNLTRLDQRYITVPLNISEGRSYVPATEYPKTVRVIIRGDRDQIYRIRETDIVASLDLTRYGSEGVFRVPVKLERRGDAGNIDPLELRADPAEIPISFERLSAKRVAISPTFKGFLEPGYELNSYEIVPPEIVIEGPTSLIASTKDISTDVIELSGKTGDFSLTVPLVKPSSLINFIDVNTVRFTAKIQKQERRITLENVTIQVVNLDPSLTYSEALPMGKMTLLPHQGQELTTATGARLVADCKDIIKPGQYSIPLTPVPPEGFDVEAYDPLVIQLRLQAAPLSSGSSGASGGAVLQEEQNLSQGTTDQPRSR
ncbi:MAG: CdaR family protein [Rectinema sp.]